jgi:hypothetical protein
MPVEIRWIASSSASAMHAACALAAEQALADAALAEALAPPSRALAAVAEVGGLDQTQFWSHLVPLAAGIQNNRELADVALAKMIGRNARQATLIAELAGRLSDLESAFRKLLPEVVEQLELRSAPLREQWEARGPGLLAEVSRRTQQDLLVERADVILVHPALGGGGVAHLAYNSCRIEAVLANPHFQLPEVARLGWLVAQLHHDLPMHQGNLSRQRVAEVGALAMIPPVLAAAEEVELARNDEPTLRLALSAWLPCTSDQATTSNILRDWWQTYAETRPAWSIALAALDRMLQPVSESSVAKP